MFDKLQVPVLGVIENMSYFICPNCNARHDIFATATRRGARARAWACRSWARSRCTPTCAMGGDTGAPVVAVAARQRVRARARGASPARWRSASASRRSGSGGYAGMRLVYADHAATTRPAPEVVEAMRPYLDGRASATPRACTRAARRRATPSSRARLEVARLLGAQAEEIVFTASGSRGEQPGAARARCAPRPGAGAS